HTRSRARTHVGVEEGARGSVDPPQPDRTGTDPLLRGIFQIGKKSHDVVLTASRITWTPIEPDHPTGELLKPQEDSVELKDVFAVKVKRRRSVGQTSGGTLLGITLFTCRPKGAKLKDHAVHLNNLSADHCEIWFKQLKEILNALLMELCYFGHISRKVAECEVVVCVGGDGSVAEVAHGLLLRAQMDAGRDTDSIFMPVQAALPLGVIPAGEGSGWWPYESPAAVHTHTHTLPRSEMCVCIRISRSSFTGAVLMSASFTIITFLMVFALTALASHNLDSNITQILTIHCIPVTLPLHYFTLTDALKHFIKRQKIQVINS
uniref:Ceramide kinase-like n=1 Tax=Astyanax mexicanus TaxID=7994 RepID=A0A8B9LPJ2_ASTMX